MRRPRCHPQVVLCLCFCLLWLGTAQEPAPDSNPPHGASPAAPKINLQADQFQGSIAGKVVAEGNVVVSYGDVELRCDSVAVNRKSADFEASGNITLVRGDMTWKGETISGNLKDKTFCLGLQKAKIEPWYLRARDGCRNKRGVYSVEGAELSTCDHLFQDRFPHWLVKVSRATIDDENWCDARHVSIWIMGVPIFYLPRLVWDLDWHWPFELNVGHDSDWGVWGYIGYSWPFRRLQRNLELTVFAETREKRGQAGGIKGKFRTDRLAGNYLLYGMYDHEPLSDQTIDDIRYNNRFETEEHRFRGRLFTRYDLLDDVAARTRVDGRSDPDMLFEFFRPEYNRDPEPSSYLDLAHQSAGYELSLNYRGRINDFETTVERQPELRLELARRELGRTSIYYQSTTTAGRYRMNFREYDLARNDGVEDQSDYAAFRADTIHMFYRPARLGWLNLVPRIGGRGTYYSDSSEWAVTDNELNENIAADNRRGRASTTTPVNNYGDDGGERVRWAVEGGVEMSFKAHRTWADFSNNWLDWQGLRHVMEPYLNYTTISQPSEEKEFLYFFDGADRLDDVNFIRLGLRQELLTRRGEARKIHEILSWELYVDYFFEPEAGRAAGGDLGSILSFEPIPELAVNAETLIDTDSGDVNVIKGGARVGRRKGLHASIDYLYRNAYAERYLESFGSDLTRVFSSGVLPVTQTEHHGLTVNLSVPIGDGLKFSAKHYYDLEEDVDELVRQRYALTKDLHCWTGEIFFSRNDDVDMLGLTFYLKAFPQTKFTFEETVDEGEDDDE